MNFAFFFLSFSFYLVSNSDSGELHHAPAPEPHLERLIQITNRVRLDVCVLPSAARARDAGDELGKRSEQALDAHARHLDELAGDES